MQPTAPLPKYLEGQRLSGVCF